MNLRKHRFLSLWSLSSVLCLLASGVSTAQRLPDFPAIAGSAIDPAADLLWTNDTSAGAAGSKKITWAEAANVSSFTSGNFLGANSVEIPQVNGLQSKLDAKVSNTVGFYDDFTLKTDNTNVTNNVTTPMVGVSAYRYNYTGTAPVFKGGGYGDVNSGLWYLGTDVPITVPGVFSFGCEFEGVNTSAGLNMSFSNVPILGAPSLGINPQGMIHTNFTGSVVQGCGQYAIDGTITGATDIVNIAGLYGVTGDPLVFGGGGIAGSGLTGGTRYYMISLTANTFKVATSYANAIAGTAMGLNDAAVNCSIDDYVVLNRTPSSGTYAFHPRVNGGGNAANARMRILFQMSGNYLTITQDKVGSVMLYSPSMGRRFASATTVYFWYEGGGGAVGPDGASGGQRMYRVWAQAPAVDATISPDLDRVYYNSIGSNSNAEDKIGLAGRLLLGPYKVNNSEYTVGQARFAVGSRTHTTQSDGTLRPDEETAISENGWIGVIGGLNAGASYGKAPLYIDRRLTYPLQTATTGSNVELMQFGRSPWMRNGEYQKILIRATVAAGGTKHLRLIEYINTGNKPFDIDLSAYSGNLTVEMTKYKTNLYTDDCYVTARIGGVSLLEDARVSYNDGSIWYPWQLFVNQSAANQIAIQFVEESVYLVRIKD